MEDQFMLVINVISIMLLLIIFVINWNLVFKSKGNLYKVHASISILVIILIIKHIIEISNLALKYQIIDAFELTAIILFLFGITKIDRVFKGIESDKTSKLSKKLGLKIAK